MAKKRLLALRSVAGGVRGSVLLHVRVLRVVPTEDALKVREWRTPMPLDQKDMQIMLTRVVMIEIHIRLSQDHCRRSFRFLTRARATCTAWFELCFTRAIIWLTPAFSEISFLQGKQQRQKGQHLFPGENAEIIVIWILAKRILEKSW